jgi:hypothetical protein
VAAGGDGGEREGLDDGHGLSPVGGKRIIYLDAEISTWLKLEVNRRKFWWHVRNFLDQFVLTGEPVAVMGYGSHIAAILAI